MYTTISKCRICKGNELIDVMSLGEQFLTGVFPKSKSEKITSGPIDLVKCASHDGCGLVQLKQSFDLDEMYGANYGYRSGLNSSMVNHLHLKVKNILNLDILKDNDLILDIGSNDATTLSAYPQDKYQLVGVDPTGIKFSSYYPDNIQLIPEFFSVNAVSRYLPNKKAKIITAFSMFYDLEDPIAFAKDIEGMLDNEGLWIFEQSYMPAMLRTNSFDTICHEHLEFYALKQINWIAKNSGLKIVDVEFNDVNGGSFSITAAKINSQHVPNKSWLDQIIDDENSLGLNSTKAFDEFKIRVEKSKNDLLSFLNTAKKDGKVVCGLGASTKGNVLLQYFNIDNTQIDCIGEVNPDKFGSFTPGTLIPLLSEAEVLEKKPDYILILPWHFKNFFTNLSSLKGKKLVFPLPEFEIVEV